MGQAGRQVGKGCCSCCSRTGPLTAASKTACGLPGPKKTEPCRAVLCAGLRTRFSLSIHLCAMLWLKLQLQRSVRPAASPREHGAPPPRTPPDDPEIGKGRSSTGWLNSFVLSESCYRRKSPISYTVFLCAKKKCLLFVVFVPHLFKSAVRTS